MLQFATWSVRASYAAVALAMLTGAAKAGPPDSAFTLLPAPRPGLAAVGEAPAFGRMGDLVAIPPLARTDLWDTPPGPDWADAPAKPGEWTTSLDPDVDLETSGAAPGDEDELAWALDPLRIDSVKLRLTRHF